MTDREIAEQIALCTCGPELPEHMRANGKHFSNCPTELVEGIEAALAQARQEARLEILLRDAEIRSLYDVLRRCQRIYSEALSRAKAKE